MADYPLFRGRMASGSGRRRREKLNPAPSNEKAAATSIAMEAPSAGAIARKRAETRVAPKV
jgi:hypothetical protein